MDGAADSFPQRGRACRTSLLGSSPTIHFEGGDLMAACKTDTAFLGHFSNAGLPGLVAEGAALPYGVSRCDLNNRYA